MSSGYRPASYAGGSKVFNVAASAHGQYLPANPARQSLMVLLTAGTAGKVVVEFGPVAPVAGGGIPVPSGAPLVLNNPPADAMWIQNNDTSVAATVVVLVA